jgi:long-chain acyl-CoA synthetase
MQTSNSDLNRNLIERVAMGDMLRRRARDSANQEALVDFVDGNRRGLCYREFNSQVNRLVGGLRNENLQQGDVLALLCSNRIEFMVFAFACYKSGIIFMPVNFLQSPQDIRYNLEHAKVSAVVFEPGLADLALSCAADLEHIKVKVQIGDQLADGCVNSKTLIDHGDDTEIVDVIIQDRDVAQLIYTSGTTARPKGVETSHLSLYFASLSNPLSMEFHRFHSHLIVLPVFHCAALVLCFATLQMGGKLVLKSTFEPVEILDTLESELINGICLLPVMWKALLQVPGLEKRNFASLEFGIYAMAALDRDTLDQLCNSFNCKFVLASGQSEYTPATSIFHVSRPTENKEGNYWGEPTVCTDQAIIDEQGNELPPGEVGEICWRGPQVMSGYLNHPEATSEVSQFGWHHSGDLGLIDNEGQLLFIDRKKDMIKTGGENVASSKVESVLLSHPGILQAAVFAVPHPRWGEAVCSAVQLTPGEELDEESIIEHCRQSLAGFQIPKRIFKVDSFPQTATGKIQKAELRKQYASTFRSGKIS